MRLGLSWSPLMLASGLFPYMDISHFFFRTCCFHVPFSIIQTPTLAARLVN
jgi:hypothetical protein